MSKWLIIGWVLFGYGVYSTLAFLGYIVKPILYLIDVIPNEAIKADFFAYYLHLSSITNIYTIPVLLIAGVIILIVNLPGYKKFFAIAPFVLFAIFVFIVINHRLNDAGQYFCSDGSSHEFDRENSIPGLLCP